MGNLGNFRFHQTGRPIEEVSENDWQGIFYVNLSGVFYMAQALARR